MTKNSGGGWLEPIRAGWMCSVLAVLAGVGCSGAGSTNASSSAPRVSVSSVASVSSVVASIVASPESRSAQSTNSSSSLPAASSLQVPSSLQVTSSLQVLSSEAALPSSSLVAASSAPSVSAPNLVPSAAFVRPLPGAKLPEGQPVTVEVDTTDADGAITQALLFVDGVRVAALSNSPWRWPGNLLPPLGALTLGTHELRVQVTDNLGARTVISANIEIVKLNNAPSVTFVYPAAADRLPLGSSVDVLVEASDIEGGIDKLVLEIDGIALETKMVPPYQWTAAVEKRLANLSAGTYTLTAIATDDQGRTGSASKRFEISAAALSSQGEVATGAYQYRQYCIECHGKVGQGTSRGTDLASLPEVLTKNGIAYSLAAYIEAFMPKFQVAQCVDQCARNIATYLLVQLPIERRQQDALVANSVAGAASYQQHCVACHGPRALGSDRYPPLLPLREEDDYPLTLHSSFVRTDVLTKIDLGMPVSRTGVVDGFAELCQGQCAVDIVAYLNELATQLTPEERLQAQVASGKRYYSAHCATCHREDGSRDLLPLRPELVKPDTLDERDLLFVYNRDLMPKRDPKACIGVCAKDVSVYIREALAR
jgi:mono/diheme cytochrome c family protein